MNASRVFYAFVDKTGELRPGGARSARLYSTPGEASAKTNAKWWQKHYGGHVQAFRLVEVTSEEVLKGPQADPQAAAPGRPSGQ